MVALVKHDRFCKYARPEGGGHTDAAKRLSDTYNLHRAAAPGGGVNYWFAVRLSDGTGDGELYTSKEEAVKYQRHDAQFYAFVKIAPCSMNVCEAESFMFMQRSQYELQKRIINERPDLELIPRLNNEDAANQIAALSDGHLPVALGKSKGVSE